MLYKAVLGGCGGGGLEGLWREGVSRVGRSLATGSISSEGNAQKGRTQAKNWHMLGRYARDRREVIKMIFRCMIRMHMMGKWFLFNVKVLKYLEVRDFLERNGRR